VSVPTPPPLAERTLALLVRDGEWRDSIVGDLREEFLELSAQSGRRFARRWYWRQAVSIGGRSVAARLVARPTKGTSWIGAADMDAGGRWTAGLTRDMRHAWRAIARRPATSAVIVLTLALTLATNSAIFALLDSLVLRPFRLPDIDRVAVVISTAPQDPWPDSESVAPADFRDWRSEVRTLAHLSAAEWWDANLSGIDTPEQIAGFRVSAGFFDALGVQPMLGRDFLEDEETPGRDRRAILGYGLWNRRFAADPEIVGKTVRLDGEQYEVVGIAPRGFAIPLGAEVWSPLAYSTTQWDERRRGSLTVIGRLVPGASLEHAGAELTTIVDRQRREHPDTNRLRNVTVPTFQAGMADPGTGPFMATIQAAGLLLMMIACANIANLLLARGAERTQEYSMRLALGASRERLAWQVILEGAALASIAVLVAMPLSWALIGVTRASIPSSIIRFLPGYDYIRISPGLFALMAATAAAATLIFSLFPALTAGRISVAQSLRAGGRSSTGSRQRHWLRSGLATAQVALTLALLFASGLVLSAADRATNGALGFDRSNLAVAGLMFPERPYAEPQKRREFVTTVLDRMRSMPAVASAGVVSSLPYGGNNSSREFWPDGVSLKREEVRQADFRRVSAGYFDAMRIPLLAGRAFDDNDRVDTAAVAIVSRNLVDRYWPTEDPLGRRFKLAEDGAWITVVGVVGDVVHDWFQQRRAATVYRPVSQDVGFAQIFVARTIGDPMSVTGDLRRAIAAADPDQPIMQLTSMTQFIEDRTSGVAFIAKALSVVAVIAFVLAISGLYSLMAFLAGRRTQEIGVRMALGAGWWSVIRLATSHALRITLAGLVIGAVLAASLGRVMETILLGIVSANWIQLGGLSAMLLIVALLAAYIPARRAAAVNPTMALRGD
jgi:putative ABC transport system permease protein